LDEQAGILASNLLEGKPCPVCGSTSHPQIAKMSEHAPTEAEVKKAKQAYEIAQADTNKASEKAGSQRVRLEEKEKTARKHLLELLPETAFDNAEDGTNAAKAELQDQIGNLEEKIKLAQAQEKQKEHLEKTIPQTEKALEEAKDSIGEVQNKQAALKASLTEQKKQLEEKKKKLHFESKSAAGEKQKVLETELSNLQTVHKNAIDACNTIEKDLATIQGEKKPLEAQLTGAPEIDTTEAETQKTSLTQEIKDLSNRKEAVASRLTTNSAAKNNIAKKADEIIALETNFAWMNALSDTANGKISGKDKAKISLEVYYQGIFFDHILSRANVRLYKMSGGQYELKRSKASTQGQHALDLDIHDYVNGSERSVRSLSGGEAFLASLALALGLSDEIQMSTGVQLDTLFVDEGFGSLDPDALSKAYNALDQLTEGNRLVGIISHVSDLKERINKQIVVRKDNLGISHCEIRCQ